jgi:hypothetical protein
MSNFLAYRAANSIGCIFPIILVIMIIPLLGNKNGKNIYRKNNTYVNVIYSIIPKIFIK